MEKRIYVSREKKEGAFLRVTDALNSIPEDNKEPVSVWIEPGVYHEKITVNRPFVTLEGTGESSADTVLTFDDYANFIMEDGMKRGTFRSYSVFVDAHDVTLRNLTVENASGDSTVHGQAIALYADGDRLLVESCRLLGHQDTLFTGPLPPKEMEKNGFIGPKQYAPRINGRQYYKDCYICGDVDFIFGSATAFFENCTVESLRRFALQNPEEEKGAEAAGKKENADSKIQGYVTAASTPEGQKYGYVFSNCRFISGDCPAESVYLGRPWREFAKTVFVDCSFGAHIRAELFHDWNKRKARETVEYAVCDSDLRAGDEPADFVRVLNEEEKHVFDRERVLGNE